MTPASRPRDVRSTSRRGLFPAAILAAGALVGALGLASSASASSRSAPAEPGTSLSLAGQTSWVRGPSGLKLQLRIATSLPVARLGLKFVLYSRLTSRSAFDQSLSGSEPASELPIDAPNPIPLAALDQRQSASGSVTVRFPVVTAPATASRSATSPKLDLACGNQCDGVYPLEAALVDSSNGNVLATVTTHLIYTAGANGTLPLNVALVLPVGTEPALTAAGASALGTGRLMQLKQLVSVLLANPGVRVTIQLYPQLRVALERDHSKLATSVLASLDDLLARAQSSQPPPTRQVLKTTFVRVDPTALADAGLGREFALQLDRGARALGSPAGAGAAASPYVAYGPLDARSLALLTGDGVRQVVVPSTNVTTPAGEAVPTVALTSPFRLLTPPDTTSPSGTAGPAVSATGAASGGGPVALVADPSLAAHFGNSAGDPELAAHQLLADLSQIYFDAPGDAARRGVVVAPPTWSADPRFLGAVLAGLSDSPILRSLTLGQAFQLPVGGNFSPTTEQLVPGAGGASTLPPFPTTSARADLATVESILPGDRTALARLADALLLGEASGMSRAERNDYDAAPRNELGELRRALSLTGGKTITLTSRTGRIPLTFASTFPYPIHGVVELRDGGVTFTGGTRAQPETFGSHTTPLDYPVSTLTSGDSHLDVVVLSPKGNVRLLLTSITIRSTAVSGVAVALSIGALLVLGAWWSRSVLRHRRRAAHLRSAASGVPESEPVAPA